MLNAIYITECIITVYTKKEMRSTIKGAKQKFADDLTHINHTRLISLKR